MFLGALLDGLPEAFILGIGIAAGDGVSVAFVAAVFVSNIPQGAAGTISMLQAGMSATHDHVDVGCAHRRQRARRRGRVHPCRQRSQRGAYAQAFAAGALLVMLADSMMPEAFEHGGKSVGLLTVLGYLAAAALTAVG